jgi:hypothetical protein
MLRTLEAVIDGHNHVQWLEHFQLLGPQRVLITLLDSAVTDETLLMSEPALVEWLNDDEEAAWAHLQQGV